MPKTESRKFELALRTGIDNRLKFFHSFCPGFFERAVFAGVCRFYGIF